MTKYRVHFRNAISPRGREVREYATLEEAKHAARTVQIWNNTNARVETVDR